MSTPKKKKPAPKKAARPRTCYDVALDHARARLEKAVQERTDILMKLDKLAREIPYLETLVMALTPPSDHLPPAAEIAAKEAAWKVNEEQNALPPTPPPVGAPTQMDQAKFLAQFMPRPGRIATNEPPPPPRPPRQGSDGYTSADPDEFLSDDGRGTEMLP
jgi:hypothetical protein